MVKTVVLAEFETGVFTELEYAHLRQAVELLLLQFVKLPTGGPSLRINNLKIRITQRPKISIFSKELGFVNTNISASEQEVRVWCCDADGISVFRIKAIGAVHLGQTDIIVVPPNFEKKNEVK